MTYRSVIIDYFNNQLEFNQTPISGNSHLILLDEQFFGFETYAAPDNFNRAAQPVDIYSVFSNYYKTNSQAKYIYTVTSGSTSVEIHGGTSYSYGYELTGTTYTAELSMSSTTLTTAINANDILSGITVNNTTNFPNSGTICIVGNYLFRREYFTYTSKDATHFYGPNKTFTLPHNAGGVVDYCIDWIPGSIKRWVIVNHTSMVQQICRMDNIPYAEWIYCGDKINQVITGNSAGG